MGVRVLWGLQIEGFNEYNASCGWGGALNPQDLRNLLLGDLSTLLKLKGKTNFCIVKAYAGVGVHLIPSVWRTE